VLKDGKPVAGIGLGLVQQSRSATTFLGDKTTSTNENGFFEFVNVPANEHLYVYGLMDSCRKHGAIPQIEVSTGANGSSVTLGEISFQRGFSISGRIVLSDDSSLPPNTRMLISREGPWDGQQALVAPDGTFEITGVPAETCTLSVRVRGYRPSARNQSLDVLNPFGLLGLVDADIENLEFLLESGDYLRYEFDQELSQKYQALKTSPLRGVN
jgi:hypothetical protein